jgi:hypothetical protein
MRDVMCGNMKRIITMALLSAMCSLFGCGRSQQSQEEPPIQNLGSFDIVGERKDGGVDLVIVSSSHLDGSSETQALLRQKVENYLGELQHPEFQAAHGKADVHRTAIILYCIDQPDQEILKLIDELKATCAQYGASLRWELIKSDI